MGKNAAVADDEVQSVADSPEIPGRDSSSAPAGRSVDTLTAAAVRSGLGLTAHQLGELTSAMDLDIGPRPNYPRYDFAAVHLLVVVKLLRDTRVPLEPALNATVSYQAPIHRGEGWLLCAPSPRGWLSSLLLAAGDLTGWLYTSGGCGVVVDLASVAEQAAARWELLRSPTPDRQGVSQADPSTDQ